MLRKTSKTRIKSLLVLILVAVMSIGLLSACGKQGTGGSTEGAKATPTPTKKADPTPTTKPTEAPKVMDGEITVITREDGSGTRGAFVELVGLQEKTADGKKVDRTWDRAEVKNGTNLVITAVENNKRAIGYISLGSLSDRVKAIKVDGVEPTVDNILAGQYKIARPFNIATKGEPDAATQDFINYILSTEGQAVVKDNNLIPIKDPKAFTSTKPTGTINVSGSSSVGPVMEKLKEAYGKINAGVEIKLNVTDSSSGMKDAADGTSHIGMASRELKDSEIANGLTPTVIATDGIVVIVNNENAIEGITSEEITSVFKGETREWNKLGQAPKKPDPTPTPKPTEAPKVMDGEITVITREDGSGTRGAFVELVGLQEKTADGKKVDRTWDRAEVKNGTNLVITAVENNKRAIGYISLGSLSDRVKAIKVDGVEPTVDNILAGQYKIARPFNIATKGEPDAATQDFINYILSTEGQAVVKDNNLIPIKDPKAFTSTKPTGTINVSGSSSVGPVMEKLKEAYGKINAGVEIKLNVTDSSSGMKDAADGTSHIGMASRELKDSEIANGLTPTVIATDGIVVIVNNENPIADITSEEITSVFKGETREWNKLGQ